MNSFQAFTLREQDTSVIGQLETITLDDLSEGTVVIKAAYSSVNFRRRWLTRRQRSPHHCNWCDRRCCDIVYCDVASIRLHFNHCIN